MGDHPIHLLPPPGFTGLDPDLPIESYHRNLSHWRQKGATYFVTFRLGDALPMEKQHLLKDLRKNWERTHPVPRDTAAWNLLAREVIRHEERWLDEGYGSCHFRELRWCEDLRARLHRFHDARYFLSCWAIMPNHCHLLVRPFDDHRLEKLVGAIKGACARSINAALRESGALWEEESYDRIIRDTDHLWKVIQYIGRSPAKAGVAAESEWRRWLAPEWADLGWAFKEQ